MYQKSLIKDILDCIFLNKICSKLFLFLKLGLSLTRVSQYLMINSGLNPNDIQIIMSAEEVITLFDACLFP